ncbi:PRC-barrel domain-containing protein [Hydrogenophaga sp.]|uniref:PRC-barrel domain-containing protein n=1 Tax=Hydrogenophaga sp. TaxID=1904254 RepID=UPI0025C1EA77|nr:PRC-barrel domain-containing protein [Hydrogenophaga sp.]
MFNSLGRLSGSTVTATDGLVGHFKAAFFDDNAWTIRYLVVNTGNWLSGREVLISPCAVKQPVDSGTNIDVALTRAQVKASPDIDTQQPVSRQHEHDFVSYYSYPNYWEGSGLWGWEALPLMPPYVPTPTDIEVANAMRERDQRGAVSHLRSSAGVKGYDIQASDGSIGHVQDFVFDDVSWAIRYLVVETRNWWPGGKHVLIATQWIDSIDWASGTVQVSLKREQVKNSPGFVEPSDIGRDDEKRLHDAYCRQGYWA